MPETAGETMQIRFTIEQRHLTDEQGRPVNGPNPDVTFHNRLADSAEEAVRILAGELHGEVIGEILRFPGFQAVATLRSDDGVFTLQVSPSSQQIFAIE
jgi:hypothetical protein